LKYGITQIFLNSFTLACSYSYGISVNEYYSVTGYEILLLIFFDYPEDGIKKLIRNVGNELPFTAVFYPMKR